MYTHRNFTALLLLALGLLASCNKEPEKTVSCVATMYGYSAAYASIWDTVGSRSFGSVSPTTVLLTSLGSINTSTYSNQAAFNTADDNYYVFKTHMGSSGGYGGMYRVSSGGAVSFLAAPPSIGFSALTYNRATNKLYCMASVDTLTTLSEVVVTGTSFSLSGLAAPIHAFGGCTTVDDFTGAIYYTSSDSSNFYIEKYIPGSGGPVVIATGTAARSLLGLRFNKNDHLLYVVKEVSPASTGSFEFLNINPATGSITTLSTLTFPVNREFYSASIDPCQNRYIIATLVNSPSTSTCEVNQLSMSGALLQHNVTTDFYQGLDVKY